MKVRFQRKSYTLVFTDHAVLQMDLRGISKQDVVKLVERGTVKAKPEKGKFWVFLSFKQRKDNSICASISLEAPNLVVITTLVNWSPK